MNKFKKEVEVVDDRDIIVEFKTLGVENNKFFSSDLKTLDFPQQSVFEFDKASLETITENK